jgi:chemotaxis protein MotB
MARARRESRAAIDVWPGFVDALSTLLLSIIFLLVVFVLGQFFLGQMLQGRNEAVERLRGQVETLEGQIDLERETASDLRRSLARLSSDLQALMGERDDLRGQLAESEKQQSALDARMAQLGNERTVLQRALEEARLEQQDARSEATSLRKELEARVAQSQDEATQAQRELEQRAARIEDLTAQAEALRQTVEEETAAKSEAMERVTLLSDQIKTLSGQLTVLEQALSVKETEIAAQNQQIADLGQRLNLALASKVEELSQARSDFFGKLRRILGDREDVRTVGDRFVFQSEVLFQSGQAEIEPRGRAELARFADAFKQIMPELPADLNWVLQVDGHTDRRPINTPRFPSNWELSAARAISVARFLVSQGIPAERVAARGFAEWQPLDPAASEEAYRRNRRIEIKLTTS